MNYLTYSRGRVMAVARWSYLVLLALATVTAHIKTRDKSQLFLNTEVHMVEVALATCRKNSLNTHTSSHFLLATPNTGPP